MTESAEQVWDSHCSEATALTTWNGGGRRGLPRLTETGLFPRPSPPIWWAGPLADRPLMRSTCGEGEIQNQCSK
ncbi:hypothetical protein NL676_013362 [Syzygium grande]|nr:hypothetical protein NL676_013362 [Syzygium grande]